MYIISYYKIDSLFLQPRNPAANAYRPGRTSDQPAKEKKQPSTCRKAAVHLYKIYLIDSLYPVHRN